LTSGPRSRHISAIASTDIAGNQSFAYLDAARADEFFAALKDQVLDALEVCAGGQAADVGCGTGDDVAALATRGAFAVGFDVSAPHVAEAQRRWGAVGIDFVVADVHSLPVRDETLDACRVERTLQHVTDPGRVVGEIIRALRPGGRLAVSEPDWETCVVCGGDPTVSRAVVANWIPGRNRNPRVGRELRGLLSRAGFEGMRLFGGSAIYDSFARADDVFPLARAARQAAADHVITPAAADAWLSDLQLASDQGAFLFAVTMFTAVAVKPTRPQQ
jgi:SAM-dependent methyltransferase